MDISQKLQNIPKKPGIYKFLNKTGQVIYIGKAKNLRARVRQYFGKVDKRPQIPYLLDEVANIDYIVVNSELESLYLENNLIKQYHPKYNIELKDDKNYAFIKIDYSTEIPQILAVRKIEDGLLFQPPFNSPLSRGEGRRKEIPQIIAVRKIEQPLPTLTRPSATLSPRQARGEGRKDAYFGPYTAAYKIRETLHLIRKIFSFCGAKKVSSNPCFYFHLHRCPGICIGKISLEDYSKHLEKIKMFLAGKIEKVAKKINQEMIKASKTKKFEQAARLRDQLKTLEMLEAKQTVILPKKVDWDIVSLALDENFACVNLFKVRKGKLQDKENFVYEITPPSLLFSKEEGQYSPLFSKGQYSPLFSKEGLGELVQTFCEQYYLETSSIPKEIYLQNKIEDVKSAQKLIFSRFSKNVKISMPQKGKPKQLIRLGQTNAREYLKNWLADNARQLDRTNSALNELKTLLNLPQIPRRIEAYDISNIQGTNAVGSMVVFLDGMPAKSQYRKFKIQSKQIPDDTGMMREMIFRRLQRINSLEGKTQRGFSPSNGRFAACLPFPRCPRSGYQTPTFGRGATPQLCCGVLKKIKNQELRIKDLWPMPDLMVIDGGKGQLNAALAALRNLKSKIRNPKQIPIISLAKRLEEIFIPGRSKPIILLPDNPALQLLQNLRDEAHRFAIAFHRRLRSKTTTKSALDDIEGVGPKTKKLLKAKFGTVADIRKASLDDLVATVGKRLAQLIQQSFL